MGGSGVQRPTKMVKYWARLGWRVTVLQADPSVTLRTDPSLLSEVDHSNITTVNVSGGVSAIKGVGWDISHISERWLQPIRKWINPWLVPDNKKGWVAPVVDTAIKRHQSDPFDVIIATAPPYSSCLASVQIKQQLGIPLVLDFRDDWMGNPLMRFPTAWHRDKHKRLESNCLQAADQIWTINDCIASDMRSRNPDQAQKITVIPQGYDPEDLDSISVEKETYKKNTPIRLLYSGMFYGKRQPYPLLHALATLNRKNPIWKRRFVLEFQGGLDRHHKKKFKQLGIDEMVVNHGYVPHHQALANAKKADVLWLIIKHQQSYQCVTTSKLFEYMGLSKPILALTTAKAPLKIIRNYRSQWIADPDQIDNIVQVLIQIWENHQSDEIPKPNLSYVQHFDRFVVARQSSELLDKICTIAHA